MVKDLANLALFAVLFSDGMRVGWKDLTAAFNLPGRALIGGLPLTLLVTAVGAHYIAGVDWTVALLIGAVLSPTDPVFAAALVGNHKVPGRLRHLLNVESGVNDGIALPFVIVFLAVVEGKDDLHLGEITLELVLGLVIGVVVPYAAIRLERLQDVRRVVGVRAAQRVRDRAARRSASRPPCTATSTSRRSPPASRSPRPARVSGESFEHFGELVAELFKLAALLVFGALISPQFLGEIPWQGWVFAVFALVVARPAALAVSFFGSGLTAARAGRRVVVRAQGLRLGRLRAAGARVGRRRGRRGLPPGRADDRAVDPRALLDRRAGREVVRRGARDARVARQGARPRSGCARCSRVTRSRSRSATTPRPWRCTSPRSTTSAADCSS